VKYDDDDDNLKNESVIKRKWQITKEKRNKQEIVDKYNALT
jgi:hypothetical protein